MQELREKIKAQWQKSSVVSMIVLLVQKIGNIVYSIRHFFSNHKNMMTMMIPFSLVAIWFFAYFMFRLVFLYYTLQTTTADLYTTNSYDTSVMPIVQQEYHTVADVIQGFQDSSETVQRYQKYIHTLQIPYTSFLQHILLPSLYIRKDPYTSVVDTQLVGRKFVEKNPFTDTALIQYRSDFLRNVGDGTDYIAIKDMRLQSLEEENDMFSIPMTVSFIAPTKRAFLLLIDKLSLTSQETNISLMNEFFYYLRQAIKDQKKSVLPTDNTDTYIWQSLYERALHDGKNTLIDSGVLLQAIQNAAQCQLLTTEQCLYTFRNIYRSIPQLAYGIGLGADDTAISSLKKFIQDLPPVLTIDDFVFQKIATKGNMQAQYEWSVTIRMYGKNVTEQDRDEIAYILWNKCLGGEKLLWPDTALEAIDVYLRHIADAQLVQQQSNQLLELRRIVMKMQDTFPSLHKYDQVIKIFELSRMLSDQGICKQ